MKKTKESVSHTKIMETFTVKFSNLCHRPLRLIPSYITQRSAPQTSDSLVTELFKVQHVNSNTKLIYKEFFVI
ncbi:hypothetical protein D0856_03730 [Vibrio owensii]|nr:hypothetical protein A9237_14095 [Vibrio owensii]AYO19331.1 hypothetical protein D0856_03730 [Vibrio owensii]